MHSKKGLGTRELWDIATRYNYASLRSTMANMRNTLDWCFVIGFLKQLSKNHTGIKATSSFIISWKPHCDSGSWVFVLSLLRHCPQPWSSKAIASYPSNCYMMKGHLSWPQVCSIIPIGGDFMVSPSSYYQFYYWVGGGIHPAIIISTISPAFPALSFLTVLTILPP